MKSVAVFTRLLSSTDEAYYKITRVLSTPGPQSAGICNDYVLVEETPELYSSPYTANFMEQELTRPSKQWIHNIIAGTQEEDQVILCNSDYILLPDTERVNRYWRSPVSLYTPSSTRTGKRHLSPREHKGHRTTLNWLAIARDPTIKTLRDLRGSHVPMLKKMLDCCIREVEKLTGIPRDQVMAYVHYPPSVYQLHVHFSFPYGQYCHRDTYRIHSLQSIINNLQIDGEYYAKATLQLAMFRHSPHFAAITSHTSEVLPNDDDVVKKKR